MYLLQERSINTMKKNKDIEMAIRHCRYEKDKNWRNLQQYKSLLLSGLEKLSEKSEEELTKKELYELLKLNCDYMKALSLYNYFRGELSALLVERQENKESVED